MDQAFFTASARLDPSTSAGKGNSSIKAAKAPLIPSRTPRMTYIRPGNQRVLSMRG